MLNAIEMLRATRLVRPVSSILGALLMAASPAAAQVAGYLNNALLNYEAPPPPKAALDVEMDLILVRALRAVPGSLAEDEAIGDAQAYFASDIIVRFGDAAHLPLNAKARPILVHILSRALPEVADYIKHWKEEYPRPRPYAEDAAIQPCYERFLKPQESYPSGHAANGLTAALLIAEVMPARRQALIARGIRYGDNRVACGVHHPSDVYHGRMVASAYVPLLLKNPVFREELECARIEQRRVEQGETGKPQENLPPKCAALGL